MSKNCTVVFRCEGSETLGMGHVVRCSALAKALHRRAVSTLFVVSPSADRATGWLQREGLQWRMLPVRSGGGDGASALVSDAEATAQIATDESANWVVVDHPSFGCSYLKAMARAEFGTVVIDDTGRQRLHQADLILNQNLGADALYEDEIQGPQRLLGPRYSLLRPEFKAARESLNRRFSAQDANVLVTLGGGDTWLQAKAVLSGLAALGRRLHVRCIVAGVNKRRAAELSRYPHSLELLDTVRDITSLMTWADLSISGGGCTVWELCCLGVPMLVLVLSDDQADNVAYLEHRGYAKSLGRLTESTPAGLASAVSEILSNPDWREAASVAGRQLVDGRGADRVADALLTLSSF